MPYGLQCGFLLKFLQIVCDFVPLKIGIVKLFV